MSRLREWICRLWATLRRSSNNQALEREIACHLELAEEDLRRGGHSPEEAARLARVRHGKPTQAIENLRDQQGVPWLGTFTLDLKLGFRMLRRHWSLTLGGGLAMAVAMGMAAVIFGVMDTAFWSTLPLDEGSRVVAIQTWDSVGSRRRATAMADFERWSDKLVSLEDIGAFQMAQRQLVTQDGLIEAVDVAEMTATGFRLARVAPLRGRTLVQADELDSAPAVLVIGHEMWQTRFASDPAIVGSQVRLDNTVHTIVGVMPEGFAFPVNHSFWTPLRVRPPDYLREGGPWGVVFGRLRKGTSLAKAHAEVTAMGLLPALQIQEGEQLQPRVVPYTFAFTGDFEQKEAALMVSLATLLLVLLLLPPCANIAILIYARTVARQVEFATRHALGASRRRIVVQLFLEVLVLAAVAGTVALGITQFSLKRLETFLVNEGNKPPFWLSFDLSIETVVFVAGLALLAATIAGLAPAFQATHRMVSSGLMTLGRGSRMQLGAIWTGLVIAQVAFCLAGLPTAVEMAWGNLRPSILGPGFAAKEYLTTRMAMKEDYLPGKDSEPDRRRFAARLRDLQSELVRQLEAEPGISEVAVSSAKPGEEPFLIGEVERTENQKPKSDPSATFVASTNQVDDRYFEVFDVSLLAGRRFNRGDLGTPQDIVIVNRTLAEHLAGNGNPLGMRIRSVHLLSDSSIDPGPWLEIVGVVDDLHAHDAIRRIYRPLSPGLVYPVHLSLHLGASSGEMPARVRELSMSLDPALRLDSFITLDELYRQHAFGNYVGSFTLAAVTLSLLLLSAAGLYALMSFTVAQRRREIAIRSALGAQPRRVLAGIFKRAASQVAAGAAVGVLLAFLIDWYVPIEQMGGKTVPGILPAAAALMLAIGVVAALGPARTGLRLSPTEALHKDG